MRKNHPKSFFERLTLFLSGRPVITISIFLAVSFLSGFLIFIYYIVSPQKKDFNQQPEVKSPNYQLYDQIAERYELDKEEDEQEEEGDEQISPEVVSDEGEISDQELEEVLADTLFELYEFTEGNWPTISERGEVWQDLGLGGADNYRGTRDQNIKFLKRLKEEMDNTGKDEKSN